MVNTIVYTWDYKTCVRHSTSTSVRYTPREKRKLATLEHWQICNTNDSYGWCCSTRRWGHQLRELSSPVHTQESAGLGSCYYTMQPFAYLQAARKNYARLEHWLRWNRNTGPGGTGTLISLETALPTLGIYPQKFDFWGFTELLGIWGFSGDFQPLLDNFLEFC